MANINKSVLHNFRDGEVVHDVHLNQTVEVLRVAINDTDDRVTNHQNAPVLDHPDGSVTTEKLADGAVTTKKLANAAVTTLKIADRNVTTQKIAYGAVGTDEIADGAVTGTKLASGSVSTVHMVDGSVTQQKLANGAVGTDKLADGAVTSPKLADGSVTNTKIAANSVGTGHIIDGAVTAAKIAANAVGTNHIANNAVTTEKLAPGAVTADKLHSALLSEQIAVNAHRQMSVLDHPDGSVTTAKLANKAVTAAKVNEEIALVHQLGTHKHVELAPVIVPTFSRSSVAYKSDGTQVAAGVPRFETVGGRTGVLIEEGTTNLLLYSEDFTQSVWDKTNVTVTPAGTYLNFPVTRFTPTGAGYAQVSQIFSVGGAANRTYTWSFWARGQTARTFHVNFHSSDSDTFQSYAINLDTKWKKFTITHTFPATATFACIQWGNVSPYWGVSYTDWIEVAGVQVEEKPYATSYVKTTSSTATRAAERLTVPTAGLLDPREGTIELWINPSFVTNWNNFFNMSINTGRFLLFFSSDGRVVWDFGTVNDSIQTGKNVAIAGQWLNVAMRWSASKGTRELFVNGKLIGSKPFTPPDSFPTTVDVVNKYSTLIDDLRISNIARSDEEIAAAYESGKPLPWDEYTTALFTFDGYLDTGPRAGSYRILHEGTNQTVIPKKAVILAADTRTVELSYDANGRITSVVEKDGATTVKTTTLTYGADGNLTQVQESAGGITVTTTLSYSNGQLVNVSKSVT